MATAAEIALVRINTNEPSEEVYTDEQISILIDLDGVISASAKVWETKAGIYADLVNSSEAGASHSFSDLHKNALAMVTYWNGQVPPSSGIGRPHVRKIVRS